MAAHPDDADFSMQFPKFDRLLLHVTAWTHSIDEVTIVVAAEVWAALVRVG
jgi:hypothetical protein